jgi:hypothetical protein
MSHGTYELAEILCHKHDLLVRLGELARRQLELIQSGDWAGLMRALSDKSRMVNALCDAERRLDPYRAEDPVQRSWPDTELHQRCRRLTTECGELLAEIVRIEQQSETLLTRRRDEAKSRLQGMHTTAAAHAAYLSAETTTANALDIS